METPKPERVADVRRNLQSGLRVHAKAEGRIQSVQLADDLSRVHDELNEVQLPTVDETTDIRAFFTDADRQLQRTRKTVEVVEDSLRVGLGHSKLARIAMTGAQLSSSVALVIAGHNLLISANKLDRAHAAADTIQDIAAKRFHDFYRAIGLLVAEAILFATPINYRIAWKGTRFLNNRFLYKLRHSSLSGPADALFKGLHRLMLSEMHYAIRGILPAALRTPDEFVTYLTSIGTQTLAILREFSDLAIREIPDKAEQIINEYRVFAENTYKVATADVDVMSVVQDVVAQFTGEVDLFSIPEPRHGHRL